MGRTKCALTGRSTRTPSGKAPRSAVGNLAPRGTFPLGACHLYVRARMWAAVRRLLKWFLVLTAVAVPAAHWLIGKSDAFAVASAFLKTNSEVVRTLGQISDASLSWRGASMSGGGDRGRAQFTVVLEGQKRDGRAYVELRKRGIWEVQFARLLPESGEPMVLFETHEPNHCASPCKP